MTSFESRKQAYFDLAREKGDGEIGLATALTLGRTEPARKEMQHHIDFCRSMRDCVDFHINTLLRARLGFADQFPAEVDADLRDVAATTPFYGAFTPTYPLFRNSENHHVQYATAEYLCGLLYPDQAFQDGYSGADHVERAKGLLRTWLNRRLCFGYCEWNSSVYMTVNIAALLNLVDFAPDDDIRTLATDAMTMMLADVLGESVQGRLFCAQARIYEAGLIDPSKQGLQPALALWFGAGTPAQPKADTHLNLADCVATSSYTPPAWLDTLRPAGSDVWVQEERHRTELSILYKCRSSFRVPPEELVDEECMKRFLAGALVEVAVRTERTPEYVASAAFAPADAGAIEPTKSAQAQLAIGGLNGRTPIFVSQPPSQDRTKPGKSQYWAGNATAPAAWVRDGVVAAVYHEDSRGAADMTHAYFPTEEFDKWEARYKWFVAMQGDAYLGVRCMTGATLTTEGEWAGRELVATGRRTAWVLVFGRKADDGTFDDFVTRCEGMAITWDAETTTLNAFDGEKSLAVSPNQVLLDGEPLDLDSRPALVNPVCRSEFGKAELIRRLQGSQERHCEEQTK